MQGQSMNHPVSSSSGNQPVYAIIPAAGSGSRMGAGRNKQFLEVGGLPLIIRTLLAFERHERVTGYIVVAAPDETEAMALLIQRFDLRKFISLADGGETRQASVLSGLRKLQAMQPDAESSIVLVHDGARCFVSESIIDRCIAAIQEHGGACGAAVPVKDTIKLAGPDGMIEQTLDRSRLWAMQTPQGALFNQLFTAYAQLEKDGRQVTDDLAAMEAVGQSTWLVAGDYTNIKMTTPEDLVIGEAIAGVLGG